jgi:FAD/FMN-containing dehydrogenase
VLADGRVIHSGGNVVKNVAGYDLMKLFIGSRGSLGMIVEAVFKLRPIPESEQIVETECATLDDADRLIGAVMDSELTPVVLDLHNARAPFCLVLGFAGTREEVDWQLSKARELGFTKTSSLDYDGVMRGANSLMQTISVLPSKMLEALRELRNTQFVARAGNGVIYCRGPQTSMRGGRTPSAGAQKLSERLKAEFDPSHILPALPS